MDAPNVVREDLDRFYSTLDAVASRLGGPRVLGDCSARSGWPERGVYFFFEPGENRAPPFSSSLRVVRIGTHAVSRGSTTSLWDRLKQHRGNGAPGDPPGGGNHRGSIFRRHVGAALIRSGRFGGVPPRTWGIGSSPGPGVAPMEEPLERAVSGYLARLPFLWVGAEDEPGPESIRSYIERNSIALLTRATKLDPPSAGWLGRYALDEKIRASGLWNVRHVEDAYDRDFLDIFHRVAMGEQVARPRVPDVAPKVGSGTTEPSRAGLRAPVLALISCTKTKASVRSKAAELYGPSRFFSLAYRFAQKISDEILILSALHGAVRTSDVIEPYEKTLVGASVGERRAWALRVHGQLKAAPEYTDARTVLWLVGEDYRGELLPMVNADGKQSVIPMKGLPQGKQKQWLQRQLSSDLAWAFAVSRVGDPP